MELLKDFYITIFDKEFNIKGIIDNIETLEIVKYLNKVGTFQLTLPLTTDHIELLQIGNIITKKNSNSNNDLLEGWVITMRQIKINSNGVESLQVQGSNLITWLSQRILTKQYNITDTISSIMEQMIITECIEPQNFNRKINNLIIDNTTTSAAKTTYITQSQYSSLTSALNTVASAAYIGFEILIDSIEKRYVVKIYNGIDRSQNNRFGNIPVIFSSNLNNIMSESYIHTNVNFNNTCYVYAQLEENNKNENKLIVVGDENAGLERFETSISGSDPTLNGAEIQLTKENYKTIMSAVGEQSLALAAITKNFTGQLNLESNLQYKKDFDLGDTVTCYNLDWGIYENNIITSVTEQWSVNGLSLKLGFGYPLPTLLEKINKEF